MRKSKYPIVEVRLDKIVGGGQALGTLDDGRKLFAWGGLPGELVRVQITKMRAKLAEGRVVEVLEPSSDRIAPVDTDSYLSTSPWQIMSAESEQHYKAALIEEAFELHDIVLPDPITVAHDDQRFGYRNKVEFSWYWDNEAAQLELAFFMRGSKGKLPVDGTSLARPEINLLARQLRDLLRTKAIEARSLKTVMIRCTQAGECVWQLYVKDKLPTIISHEEAAALTALGGEIIYSDPKSPASRITERLAAFGTTTLTDTIRSLPFHYATESFFQVNLPVYELALDTMSQWVSDKPVLDLYSGVGTIGLTIGGPHVTLVEVDAAAVSEMQRNIAALKSSAVAVHAASEQALEYITGEATSIVDPPRAGLHADVVDRLLVASPERIVYLSCNPVTQARDVMRLAAQYGIRSHQGYNFFPCTPHIEHLVVLDRKA